MKILFCSPTPLVKELGVSKVVVELAEEMKFGGSECVIVGPEEIKTALPHAGIGLPACEYFRHYLHQYASEYDVVDYDHFYLPFPRSEFSRRTLFVARSVMLAHHIQATHIPHTRRLLPTVKRFLDKGMRQAQMQTVVNQASYTLQQADLINVCNHDEKSTLVAQGISADKIVVIPFGISQSRRSLFDGVSSTPPSHPMVAFVGTFDYRKGAREFPHIVRLVSEKVRDVRFCLLGTKGLFTTEKEVLSHFPRALKSRVHVIPSFQSDDLPGLLASCSVGVFPSHIEGFGFGVLEMLAASVPVIAYDIPGPRMMLPSEFLVRRGDISAMSDKVVKILEDGHKLNAVRSWSKQRSQEFNWAKIARETQDAYKLHFAKRSGDLLIR